MWTRCMLCSMEELNAQAHRLVQPVLRDSGDELRPWVRLGVDAGKLMAGGILCPVVPRSTSPVMVNCFPGGLKRNLSEPANNFFGKPVTLFNILGGFSTNLEEEEKRIY